MSINCLKSLAVGLALLVLSVVATGCQTPPEVRELADKTAANVGTISAYLRRFDQSSRDLAELRAASIARLHGANANLQAAYEYDVELVKMSGGTSNLALIDQIEAWTATVDRIFSKAEGAEAERKEQVLETQKTLDIKTKALAKIAQTLSTLAKEDNPKDRVRFLIGYSKDLKSELDEALEEDTANAKAASELLKDAKARIKDGSAAAKSRLNFGF